MNTVTTPPQTTESNTSSHLLRRRNVEVASLITPWAVH
jgi:hypothetical protein